jgi:hypothetical protein
MWFLVVAMLVILVLAGLVVLYVAFPHRGEDVPHVRWLGRLLAKGVDNAPTLDNTGEAPPESDTTSLALDLTDLDRNHAQSRPGAANAAACLLARRRPRVRSHSQ